MDVTQQRFYTELLIQFPVVAMSLHQSIFRLVLRSEPHPLGEPRGCDADVWSPNLFMDPDSFLSYTTFSTYINYRLCGLAGLLGLVQVSSPLGFPG